MKEEHKVGVEVRPGVWTTNDPKFDWDHNLKRLVNSGHGRPIPDDVAAFTLLAHDADADVAVERYMVKLTERMDMNNDHVIAVAQQLGRFKRFKKEHPMRMKAAKTLPRMAAEEGPLQVVERTDTAMTTQAMAAEITVTVESNARQIGTSTVAGKIAQAMAAQGYRSVTLVISETLLPNLREEAADGEFAQTFITVKDDPMAHSGFQRRFSIDANGVATP